MTTFKATIAKIGVNPFVFLPERTLNTLFASAQKNKGPIPIRGMINGHPFRQTLVKYSGHWRLYINGPMLKVSQLATGDKATITVEFDPEERIVPMHPKLAKALDKNKNALRVFEALAPSRKKEIVRYIGFLKTDKSVDRNVERAIHFLLGRSRFVGREKP